MPKFPLLLVLASLAFVADAAAQPADLTLERIFDAPALSGPTLRRAELAPAGDRVTFLRGRAEAPETLDLWQFDIETGSTEVLVSSDALLAGPVNLSAEEEARRERQRIAAFSGIVDYRWADNGRALLFPLGGDVFIARLPEDTGSAAATPDRGTSDTEDRAEPPTGTTAEPAPEDGAAVEVVRLTEGEAFDLDPKLAPDGRHVAFVRDADLWLVDAGGQGEPRALTTDGEGTISNALAEFIAQEEMGRDTGYWWSPDSTRIAFLQVDTAQIEPSLRYEVEGDAIEMIEQRYPYAGTPNVTYRLGVVEVETGALRWIPLGDETDIYIPRVRWLPDASGVVFQRQSRDQKTLELVVHELERDRQRVLVRETSDTWINLHSNLRFLADGKSFIWSSERSGYRHLYLIGMDGELIRSLTAGAWPVTALAGVDEDLGLVYFTAGKDTPAEQHLYRQSLMTETPEAVHRVSNRTGWHGVRFDAAGRTYLDTFSSVDQPPQLSLHSGDGERLAWLIENRIDADHPYRPFLADHQPTEFGTLDAADGQPLYWRMIRPAGFDADRQWPVFVHVYGGPTGRMVGNRWGRRLLIDQYMARSGYIVFSLDNRGIEGQGVAFQAPAYRNLGQVEISDQMVGVEYLKSLPWVDPQRVGVFGWSYGGYMTLMLLMQQPGAFAAGVAVAPVTDWALYDTHYTERYLGMPREADGNPAEAYARANVLEYAESLADPLLLVHGMADDNVLFTHSTMLMQKLQENAIDFELMAYPGEKHGISGEGQRLHVYRQIDRFFRRQLQP